MLEEIEQGGKKTYAKDNIFSIKVKKGKPITFTKVFYVGHSPTDKPKTKYKTAAFDKFYKAFHSKFETLLNDHIREWHKLWETSDVCIKGTANLQVNMRFNIYHMLICASKFSFSQL